MFDAKAQSKWAVQPTILLQRTQGGNGPKLFTSSNQTTERENCGRSRERILEQKGRVIFDKFLEETAELYEKVQALLDAESLGADSLTVFIVDGALSIYILASLHHFPRFRSIVPSECIVPSRVNIHSLSGIHNIHRHTRLPVISICRQSSTQSNREVVRRKAAHRWYVIEKLSVADGLFQQIDSLD